MEVVEDTVRCVGIEYTPINNLTVAFSVHHIKESPAEPVLDLGVACNVISEQSQSQVIH